MILAPDPDNKPFDGSELECWYLELSLPKFEVFNGYKEDLRSSMSHSSNPFASIISAPVKKKTLEINFSQPIKLNLKTASVNEEAFVSAYPTAYKSGMTGINSKGDTFQSF